VGLLPGILAGAAVQGREAFHLAGDTCSVWTLAETWVRPAVDLEGSDDEGRPDEFDEVSALGSIQVMLRPHRRVTQGEIAFLLDTAKQPADARVHLVDGGPLPENVEASAIEVSENGGWSCVFDGWELTRFLRAKSMTTEVPLELRGTFTDGTSFVAHARVELTLMAGK